MKQFLVFFINGGILGVCAIVLQRLLYHVLGDSGASFYALASGLTYIPLLVANFLIQRSMIFKREGAFPRFVASNLVIMVLVSALSPLCKAMLAGLAGERLADWSGFALAALIGCVPSFALSRWWVFSGNARQP